MTDGHSLDDVAMSSWRRRTIGELLLFVAAVGASAFLIFLVQPMVGKRILPWFGGAPAVWTLCLAFYQTALFLGYGYAHLLIRFASPGLQLAVHTLAIGAAILSLPVLPGDAWLPRDVANPSGQILLMLAANVALPFLVLASTGPLVQAWFARRHPQRSPYPLYAFSNAGSLAALVSYPFVIEPRFALSRTEDFWSFAFVGVAGMVLGCAALAWRSASHSGDAVLSSSDGLERIGRFHTALWFSLSACAVVVLMGVTNKLCIDIASVPFLWILPLATYLVTFVVQFASEASYRRAPYVILAGIALIPSVGFGVWADWVEMSIRGELKAPLVQIASYCSLLFAVCMLLHGELHRLRPPSHALTTFYLSLSAGGALGGIFVGIVAPMIFGGYYELHAGLGLACLLLFIVCARDPVSGVPSTARVRRWTAVAAITLLLLSGWKIARPLDGLIHQERSFFGVYRVFEDRRDQDVMHRLENGTTLHGAQMMGPWRRLPTSYYGGATGVGLVMGQREISPGTRLGVVGLGVGTLATYAGAGELIRFYEIDPVVVRIARDDDLFHFLEDAAAKVEIVVGDARLSLAGEQARGTPQSFDFLIIDAFNSDAVPVHLLTSEAFAHYAAALAPEGLLAVHASNRHLDLIPHVTRVGLEQGLHALQIVNQRVPKFHSIGSHWVWLSRDPEHIQDLANRVRGRLGDLGLEANEVELLIAEPADVERIPVWTDDFSDLFGLLRRQYGPTLRSAAGY